MRWLLLLLAAFSLHAHPAPRSGVGLNLEPLAYWQSDWPFIDEMKRAGGGRDGPWLLFQGNGGAHPAGRYVVLYDGRGEIAYGGAGRRLDAESRPGRDVVEVTNRPGPGLTLRIVRRDERDPLRRVRVIGPGGVCDDAPLAWVPDAARCEGRGAFRSLEAASATQTFHPAFLADLRGMAALRFAKWSAANTAKLVHWDERPKPQDTTWSGENGAPFEAMFELAQATGADPWINLPPWIDDDFARQFGLLARQSLAPGARLWLEYGNEAWNQAPPYSEAGVLAERMARQKWPGATLAPWQQRLNWHAYRSLQLCRLVKQAFGTDAARVRCVAGAQAANAEVARTLLACELAAGELGGPCAKGFDALAIAPYVGFRLGADARAGEVDRWPDDPDGGLDRVFRELARDLDEARGWIVANRQVADRHGLPLVAYEGGQHLTTSRGGRTEAMFRAANRDPRMGAALATLVGHWKAAGGQLFVALSYTEQAARGGFWGMKEHQRDDAAPKWQALRALRDAPCWWDGCR